MRQHAIRLSTCSAAPLLLIALLPVGVGQAAGLTGVDLQFISDSNPAKAEFDRDIESTAAVKGRVTGNLLASTPDETGTVSAGVSLNAAASFEQNLDIDALGESLYRLSVDAFREDRRGPGSPFYRLSLGVNYLDSETNNRDGILVDATGSLNFQPTPFFDVTFGVRTEVRDADTEVFDSTRTQWFATSNFSPFSRLVLRAGLRYVVGNEISTATPTPEIIDAADVIETDPAFGGMSANRFAYLLDADSAIAEAGIGYEVTQSIELNLLYRFVSSEADNDISYERNMLELTVSLDL